MFRKLILTVMLVAVCAATVAAQDEATKPDLTAEITIATSIAERMPVGEADTFSADVEQLWGWTRILGATDTIVVRHVWLRDGEEMASVELPVRSKSWRTWSSKKILPEWTGAWEMRVTTADGTVIGSKKFTVSAADASN